MGRLAHPQQSFRACLSLVTLTKKHGEARVEAAYLRALAYRIFSFKSVESILDKEWTERPPTDRTAGSKTGWPKPSSGMTPAWRTSTTGKSPTWTSPLLGPCPHPDGSPNTTRPDHQRTHQRR
ncbi:hypothetical protein DFAR_2330033 [Desulfarculales bacterium]